LINIVNILANSTPTAPAPEELINPIITENDEYLIVGDEEYLIFVDPI